MNGLAFDKTLNTSILRHYLDFMNPPALLGLFFINWTPPLLLYFMTLTSCKKSVKTDQPILRFCVANIDKRTNGRADETSQIHWTLLLEPLSKKVWPRISLK